MVKYTGRLKVINLAGQKVMKQNMAFRKKGETIKEINWLNIGQTESRDGLHGTLSAESRFMISFLNVSHRVPDAKDEKPTLDIYGRMFVPHRSKIKHVTDMEGLELVNNAWTAENYPPGGSFSEMDVSDRGIIAIPGDHPGMMIDLALIIAFTKVAPAGERALQFGIPLGCPVSIDEGRYFLFAPRCSETEFHTIIPATGSVFPKLPGRMHMSLGLVKANLMYVDRLQSYVTHSFRAVKLLNFPTVSLRDLKRIKGL